MGISSAAGLISGLNVDQIVTQLMNTEKRPITLLQGKQKDYELKIASFLDISTKLSAFKSALDTLNNSAQFNTRTASVTKTSSGADLLSISANSSALPGSYSLKVNQLAAANAKASQGWVDQNTTAIAAASGSFKFKVGSGGAVTTIGLTTTTTLQGLRDAINTANAGVTASIINDGTGSNPYRLVLTANNTGSSNTIYITQNDTNLDYTNKKVEGAYAVTTNTYAGAAASNSGNNYTGTTNKTFLMQMVSAGAVGTAAYKYSIDGGINWLGYGGAAYDSTKANDTAGGAISTSAVLKAVDGSGATNEGIQASFSAGTFAAGDRFTIDVFNPEMQTAQDAVINVGNSTITKSSNTITDAVQGVTLNLLKADTASTLTLTVSSDTTAANSNIRNFVDAYNTAIKAINAQLAYDPATKQKNPLLGDPTLSEIRNKIGNAVTGRIPGLSSLSYQNLSQIGITSDSKTGKLTLDSARLSSALSADAGAVSRLFIGTAVATNAAVSFISKTTTTQPGTYSVSVNTAPARATLTGNNDLSVTGLTTAETLTFMYSNNKTAAVPVYNAFSVTLSSGSTINTIVNNLNSAFATNKAGLSASNDGAGKLKITSADYGADSYFKVTTNQGAGAGQIWTASGSRENAGTDIAASINGHKAAGKGNILTANSGFAEAGLKLSIDSNQTGGFGNVSVSSGVSDRLASTMASYTDASSGMIKLKTDSMGKTVNSLVEQQNKIQARLAEKEKGIRAQFVRLEVLLQKYSTQSQYLTTQLASMQPTTGK